MPRLASPRFSLPFYLCSLLIVRELAGVPRILCEAAGNQKWRSVRLILGLWRPSFRRRVPLEGAGSISSETGESLASPPVTNLKIWLLPPPKVL